MRHFASTVFEGALNKAATSSAPIYSSAEFNPLLGSVDSLVLHVLADQVSPSANGTTILNVLVQHSTDGQIWEDMTVQAFTAQTVTELQTWSYYVKQDLSTGGSLVRLKLYLTGTSASAAARVKVIAVGRAS